MTHKTRGIVLKAVKYGETSLVVTMYTEKFGIQTYMVNGVRTTKRAGNKAAMYQPAALLDMEVYHNDQKSMHRIKECSWSYLYKTILSDVVKNSIALFMMELLNKTLKQPEANSDLFGFCEDALIHLDAAEADTSANFPLFFSLHLADFFGFKINSESYDDRKEMFLDLREGEFIPIQPEHPDFISGNMAVATAEILLMRLPEELKQVKLNQQSRRQLLHKYSDYYAIHITGFGQLKTLMVLQELLS